MAEPTASQLSVLRHALGLSEDGRGQICRNHFVTGPGSRDYDDCQALVEAELMTRHEGGALSGGDPIFVVTARGREVARASQQSPGLSPAI
jgi:hypothetical protein